MIFTSFVIALLIALIVSLVFPGKQRQLPWAGFWPLFLMTFLLVWLGGVWLVPFGPAVYGFYWAPFVVTGIVLALLIAAVTLPSPAEVRVDRSREAKIVTAAVSVFFWVLIIGAIIGIIGKYAY